MSDEQDAPIESSRDQDDYADGSDIDAPIEATAGPLRDRTRRRSRSRASDRTSGRDRRLARSKASAAGAGPALTRAGRSRRAASTVGRGIVGGALSLVAVSAVVGATLVPWPTVGGEAPSIDVSPEASATVLSCDGPLLAVGRDASAFSDMTAVADESVTFATGAGTDPIVEPLQTSVSDATDPDRYVLEPSGRDSEALAAAASAEVRDADLAGFAASACRPASMESWLVGGDASVGASDIVLIANPGDVNATVQLTVFGTEGEFVPPGAEAIAIEAQSQLAVSLAGLASGEEEPVVRVTATGAPVRAALQSSMMRTLDPIGVDRQSAVTAAERQVFPGVVVTEDGADDEASAGLVRILSRVDGEATVTVATETGSFALDPMSVDLTADVPVSVDLGSLDAGRYSVAIESESGEIVSAVWQTTGFGAEEDFAWQTPSPRLTSEALIAVPEGPGARLRVMNDGDEAATVTVSGDDDSTQELTLEPGEAASMRVSAGVAYALDPGDVEGASVHASVTYEGDASLASVAVWPDEAAADVVTVYP